LVDWDVVGVGIEGRCREESLDELTVEEEGFGDDTEDIGVFIKIEEGDRNARQEDCGIELYGVKRALVLVAGVAREARICVAACIGDLYKL